MALRTTPKAPSRPPSTPRLEAAPRLPRIVLIRETLQVRPGGIRAVFSSGDSGGFLRYLFLRPTRPTQSLSVVRSTIGVSPFAPGMPVQIQDSPLVGVQALVQAVSKDRVTLLLNILGRPQTVQDEFGQIAPL